MTEIEPTETHEAPGLDMGKTIKWYESSGVELPKIPTNTDLPYPIKNSDLAELSSQELCGLVSLFPTNAINRSTLREVAWQDATWFRKDSTGEKPVPTTNKADALSPTAIIPSYIDYTPGAQQGRLASDIWLHKISHDVVPEKVRKIILSEGFVHEFSHSIVQPALYADGYTLRFPDGRLVDGFDAMMNFAELAEQHPPISHYASTYRGKNNKFESDKPNYNTQTAINEEMAETIAAYILGFAYCGDDSRGKNPFADRPEIKSFIEDFLNAELVK